MIYDYDELTFEKVQHKFYGINQRFIVMFQALKIALRPGLKCFDFHPIHVFLNTENLNRYERTRPIHQNPKELIKYRYQGYGTRSRSMELLELANQQ